MKNKKEISKELKFIKEFSKISISKICKDLKVNRANLLNDKASFENELKVYCELSKKLNILLEDYIK